MDTIKEQFFKTTRQYFMNTNDNTVQAKNRTPEYQPKKYYIKEGPYINSSDIKSS